MRKKELHSLLRSLKCQDKIKLKVMSWWICLNTNKPHKQGKGPLKRTKFSTIGIRSNKFNKKSHKFSFTYHKFTTMNKIEKPKNKSQRKSRISKSKFLRIRLIFGNSLSIGTSCQKVWFWKETSDHGWREEVTSILEALKRSLLHWCRKNCWAGHILTRLLRFWNSFWMMIRRSLWLSCGKNSS